MKLILFQYLNPCIIDLTALALLEKALTEIIRITKYFLNVFKKYLIDLNSIGIVFACNILSKQFLIVFKNNLITVELIRLKWKIGKNRLRKSPVIKSEIFMQFLTEFNNCIHHREYYRTVN